MARNDIDWEGVEREYRAGIRSLRDIGEEFGCTHGAIRKRAERDGWERNLAGKIESRAESMVSKAVVSNEVSTDTKVSEREIVEANATVQANAILSQRRDVGRGRMVVQKLFAELEVQIDDLDLFKQLAEMMASPNENGVDKLNDLYHKVISLPSRIDGAKKLADALKVLVELERKVLRIKDDSSPDDDGASKNIVVSFV